MPELSKFSMRSVNIGDEGWLWFVKMIISEVKIHLNLPPSNLITGEHLGVNRELFDHISPLPHSVSA